MTKIKNMDDFKTITSKITSFSHAYLFNVNSLDLAYPYIKEFSKLIILGQNYEENDDNSLIQYQIDYDEFDDLEDDLDELGNNLDDIGDLDL